MGIRTKNNPTINVQPHAKVPCVPEAKKREVHAYTHRRKMQEGYDVVVFTSRREVRGVGYRTRTMSLYKKRALVTPNEFKLFRENPEEIVRAYFHSDGDLLYGVSNWTLTNRDVTRTQWIKIVSITRIWWNAFNPDAVPKRIADYRQKRKVTKRR